ncbi:uncharacterized protein LOC135943557 [Cloeon dipterum]|uniref:uncharacterized protein LOC135943557 n=1 Tax=Cloeon dipterum TaxID=197152 RepID=UPI00321FC08D
MSLHITNPHNVDFNESAVKDVDFNATAVSWYTSRDAVRGEIGFCGQDESAIKYLHMPASTRVNFNLNRTHPGDKLQIEKYADNKDISDLLSWVQEIGFEEDSFTKADFVCSRHDLLDLLLMPFSDQRFNKSVKLYLTKVNGKIYIRRMASKQDKDHIVHMDDFSKQRTTHGLIFQHYMISDSANKAPVPDKPFVRGDKTMYVVFESSVGKHQLLYASKVKALDNPEDLLNLDGASFTDVRTNMGNSSADIRWRKWLEFWGNCMTGKLDKIAIGFVGKGRAIGTVKNLEVIQADKLIPKCETAYKKDRYKTSDVMPKGEYCLDVLDKVLSFFKSELEGAKPDEVYEFEYTPADSELANIKLLGSSNYDSIFVIPKWYKEWLDRQA